MGLDAERKLDHPSPVVRQVLSQCAESCERAFAEYVAQVGSTHELFGELLRAIATVRTAADLLDREDPRRDLALRLADDACASAAARCRRYGLDEPLLRCAVACDRAGDEIQLLLTSVGHDVNDQL